MKKQILTAWILSVGMFGLAGCFEGESRDRSFVPPQPVTKIDGVLAKASVGLLYKGRLFCSGTLISKTMVLTAGHCVVEIPKDRIGHLTVGFGKNLEAPVEQKKIAKLHLPAVTSELKNPVSPFWDIAIVEIGEVPSHVAEPLPIQYDDLASLKGEKVTMSGYGQEKYNGGRPGRLKVSEGEIIEDFQAGVFEGFYKVNFASRGACRGDSGGGLFLKKGDKYSIVGLTTGSYPAINTKVLDKMGEVITGEIDVCDLGDVIYTRLETYRPWVQGVLDGTAASTKSLEGPRSAEYRANHIKDFCHSIEMNVFDRHFLFHLVDKWGVQICEPGYKMPEGILEMKVSFSSKKPHGIQILPYLHFLTDLKIVGPLPGDISDLTALTQLRRLEIYRLKSSDLVERFLTSPALEELVLVKTAVSDSNLEQIIQLPGLRELAIVGTQLGEIPSFSPLTRLEDLKIANAGLRHLDFLREVSSLRRLNLSNNEIESLSDLKKLVQLQELYIMNNHVSDLQPLSELSRLEKLVFSRNPVDISTCPTHLLQEGLCGDY